eukprot:scaffold30957_cov23-Cyclotella_meneghiniana.AAC.1
MARLRGESAAIDDNDDDMNEDSDDDMNEDSDEEETGSESSVDNNEDSDDNEIEGNLASLANNSSQTSAIIIIIHQIPTPLQHAKQKFNMEESCAACGKADVNLKSCKACKLVKYCGVDCQVAHRSKHKKACRQKARDLFDKQLFEQPPRREDCPICCIPMPCDEEESTYVPCCGKFICDGCVCCLSRSVCPFCNKPAAKNSEENQKMIMERIDRFNDANAITGLGDIYVSGTNGLGIDYSKANELYRRASELGCTDAHFNLGASYYLGRGVQVDMKKAIHHYEVAAMTGSTRGRYNLGQIEAHYGNHDRAIRHYMIAAKCGHDNSLLAVKRGFKDGLVTKEDFEKTLRDHKASTDETKSEQRDRAREMVKRLKVIWLLSPTTLISDLRHQQSAIIIHQILTPLQHAKQEFNMEKSCAACGKADVSLNHHDEKTVLFAVYQCHVMKKYGATWCVVGNSSAMDASVACLEMYAPSAISQHLRIAKKIRR